MVSNENTAPQSIDDSVGIPLPPQRSYYRHTLYAQPAPTTHVPSDVSGPSNILVSTSRGNHHVPNLPAHLMVPAFYRHLNPDGTPIR